MVKCVFGWYHLESPHQNSMKGGPSLVILKKIKHGLCVPHLNIHYEIFVDIYICYTNKRFVFLKCS